MAEKGLLSKRLIYNNPSPLDLDAMVEITEAAYTGSRTTAL